MSHAHPNAPVAITGLASADTLDRAKAAARNSKITPSA